jgi:hypothetical protein
MSYPFEDVHAELRQALESLKRVLDRYIDACERQHNAAGRNWQNPCGSRTLALQLVSDASEVAALRPTLLEALRAAAQADSAWVGAVRGAAEVIRFVQAECVVVPAPTPVANPTIN